MIKKMLLIHLPLALLGFCLLGCINKKKYNEDELNYEEIESVKIEISDKAPYTATSLLIEGQDKEIFKLKISELEIKDISQLELSKLKGSRLVYMNSKGGRCLAYVLSKNNKQILTHMTPKEIPLEQMNFEEDTDDSITPCIAEI